MNLAGSAVQGGIVAANSFASSTAVPTAFGSIQIATAPINDASNSSVPATVTSNAGTGASAGDTNAAATLAIFETSPGVYPLRNTVTSDPSVLVFWRGTNRRPSAAGTPWTG